MLPRNVAFRLFVTLPPPTSDTLPLKVAPITEMPAPLWLTVACARLDAPTLPNAALFTLMAPEFRMLPEKVPL